MIHLVTGGAGFVAANLIPQLLARGLHVVALDNLRLGRREFVQEFLAHPGFEFMEIDCADEEAVRSAFDAASRKGKITDVWHLAANSDISAGVVDPEVDFKNTFLTSFVVVKVMAAFGTKNLHFASSSAIYGDHKDKKIDELTFPMPISNYGAMKLASEAQMLAAAETFLERLNIFRFPNVTGAPASHGVIFDFVNKLKSSPDVLKVLGNGTQQKAYLHVADLVSAMLFIFDRAKEKRNIHNIGPDDDGVTVKFIAETVRDIVSPTARIEYGAGDRGWVGDVPKFRYDCGRLSALGWRPSLSSSDAVRRSASEISAQILK
ncbi:NAD-dependent epimerase/dehydratase family protein [Bosea sp. BH3]|uniref:NAD-dependent epimerase/dehydratase family protein n=1 Tax=Bosea sp. BH3 TaxID=2871701 RepID=UPI0021CB750C|nr:NAD-dependent epimerase/dehydratase family protein [Bosea sp. BH3]MCU4181148.1 NAD-dependent epimerase/dehydratase family protein [Bosea sp. BH3]